MIVSLTATDDVSGVADTFYKINEGTWTTYDGSFNMLDEGVFVIYYYSLDTLGQQETEHSVTLKIDQTVPVTNHTVTPDTPDGNNGWYKRSVTLTLTRNDSVSWINETRYQLNDGTWMIYPIHRNIISHIPGLKFPHRRKTRLQRCYPFCNLFGIEELTLIFELIGPYP